MAAANTLSDGPALSAPILWAATAILVSAIAVVVWKARSRASKFSIFAVWSRYIMSAHHALTFKPLAAGLSINAVGSIGVVGLGLLIIDKANIFQRFFVPPAILLLIMVISGAANHDLGGIMTAGTKVGYFVVVTIAVYEALGKTKEADVVSALIWSFAPLIFLQLISIATGTVKSGESDGSVSYIGGYNHEAAFSVGLAAALLVACFLSLHRRLLGNAVIIVSLIGIYLANYRTTILAIAPLAFVNFGLPKLELVKPEQRNLIRFTAIVGAIVFLAIAGSVLAQRFADVSTVAESSQPLIRDPKAFNFQERRYLSSRPYIWSKYIYAWKDGTDIQHQVGFGPESWENRFGLYAHNTIVSTLYELGYFGVAAMILWWGYMAYFAFQAGPSRRTVLLAGHASFFLMNMATMPHWMIEGNIFYGVLCGLTLYHWRLRQRDLGQEEAARLAVLSRARPAESPVDREGQVVS